MLQALPDKVVRALSQMSRRQVRLHPCLHIGRRLLADWIAEMRLQTQVPLRMARKVINQQRGPAGQNHGAHLDDRFQLNPSPIEAVHLHRLDEPILQVTGQS